MAWDILEQWVNLWSTQSESGLGEYVHKENAEMMTQSLAVGNMDLCEGLKFK